MRDVGGTDSLTLCPRQACIAHEIPILPPQEHEDEALSGVRCACLAVAGMDDSTHQHSLEDVLLSSLCFRQGSDGNTVEPSLYVCITYTFWLQVHIGAERIHPRHPPGGPGAGAEDSYPDSHVNYSNEAQQ